MRSTISVSLLRRIATVLATIFVLAQPVAGVTKLAAQQLSRLQVSDFLANPSSVLTDDPERGSNFVSRVRDLVLTDASTLPVLIMLAQNLDAQLKTASDDEKSAIRSHLAAIGSGLGQAALALMKDNPTLANQIQEAVAASGLQTVIAAYSATTGSTVAAAAGDDSGGGGVGAPITSSLPTGGGGGGAGAPAGGAAGTPTGGGLTGGGGTIGAGGGGIGGGGLAASVSPN